MRICSKFQLMKMYLLIFFGLEICATNVITLNPIFTVLATISHFSYQSIITRGFTRIDRILKVTMTPHENSELFIEEYLKLVEEREQSEFQKILEMKVLKLRKILLWIIMAKIHIVET